MTEQEAHEIFSRMRWPHSQGRPVCPRCDNRNFYPLGPYKYRCASAQCRVDFTVTTGTPFHYRKKPLSFYVRAAQMFQVGMNALYVSRLLETQHKTTWKWQQFFRAIGLVPTDVQSSGLNTIYELRCKSTARLITQSSNFEAALREARWHGGTFRANGTSLKFYVTQVQRRGWGGMMGHSNRYGRKWPAAKLSDFRSDWKAGMRVVDLCVKYDTSTPSIIKMQRRLREQFNAADDQTMLYMLTEGMTVDEISEHFQRAPNSLVRRLEYICPPETRSRLERAKRQWSESNRARRREARRARKAEGSTGLAIAAGDAGQGPKGRFDDLGLPPSALATINKKYARWDEARSRVSRSGTVLQPFGI